MHGTLNLGNGWSESRHLRSHHSSHSSLLLRHVASRLRLLHSIELNGERGDDDEERRERNCETSASEVLSSNEEAKRHCSPGTELVEVVA